LSLASPDAPNATRIAASLNLVAVVGGVALAALFMPGPPANSSVSRVVEPVRVVGAPGAEKACSQQTWPYIDARCLKRAPAESKPTTAAVKPGDLSPLTAPAAAPGTVPPDPQPQQQSPQAQMAVTSAGAGSGTDQCSREPSTGRCSFALSHTEITRSSARNTSRTCAGRAPSSRIPCRRPTRTARGCTRSAGCVPAEAAGTGDREVNTAAANCDRAEFCVHTKTTRGAAR